MAKRKMQRRTQEPADEASEALLDSMHNARRPTSPSLNRRQAADLLGISLPTLDKLRSQGVITCEKLGSKGRAYAFDGSTIAREYREYLEEQVTGSATEDELDKAKLENLIARTKLIELKLSEQQGELVPVEFAAQQVEAALTGVRERLLQIPHSFSGKTKGQVRAAVTCALEELSS